MRDPRLMWHKCVLLECVPGARGSSSTLYFWPSTSPKAMSPRALRLRLLRTRVRVIADTSDPV
jgi:hypothetical protein